MRSAAPRRSHWSDGHDNVRAEVIKAKVGLLELAKQLGSVTQACRVMGYSRDSYYRYVAARLCDLLKRFALPAGRQRRV